MAKQKKFVQNNNNLAIAYYRYSSHAQNEASIDQQREAAEKYAEAHGFTIMKEYADAALQHRGRFSVLTKQHRCDMIQQGDEYAKACKETGRKRNLSYHAAWDRSTAYL